MKPIYKHFDGVGESFTRIYSDYENVFTFSSQYTFSKPIYYIPKENVTWNETNEEQIKKGSIVHGSVEDLRNGGSVVIRASLFGYMREILKVDLKVDDIVFPSGTVVFKRVEKHNNIISFEGRQMKRFVSENGNSILRLKK